MADAICSVVGCDQPAAKRGWCHMHYNRQRLHGDLGPPEPLRRRGDLTTFVNKDAPGGCWLWLGSVGHNGYGKTKVANKHYAAHRLVYETNVGPIPDGLELDHLCRVRLCVNPEHLEPVTRRENLARSNASAAVSMRFDTCVRGHDLTPENTYVRPSRPTSRACRTCRRAFAKAQRRNSAHDQHDRDSPPRPRG